MKMKYLIFFWFFIHAAYLNAQDYHDIEVLVNVDKPFFDFDSLIMSSRFVLTDSMTMEGHHSLELIKCNNIIKYWRLRIKGKQRFSASYRKQICSWRVSCDYFWVSGYYPVHDNFSLKLVSALYMHGELKRYSNG